MANSQLYTQQAATRKAALLITSLALSKLRLIKAPFSVSRFTTKAEMVAAEADFSGYTTGGYTLTAWSGPSNNPQGGAVMTSPLVNPTYAEPEDPPAVGNDIAGWWVEDATGNVRLVGSFDPPVPMQQVGDSFPWVNQVVEAKNPANDSSETA